MAVLGATMLVVHLAWPSSQPMADHMNHIHGQGGGDTVMRLALVLAAAETLLALVGLFGLFGRPRPVRAHDRPHAGGTPHARADPLNPAARIPPRAAPTRKVWSCRT
jgi:hypothetical protein